VNNKFKFLSLSATGGKAQFTMMLPFGGAHLSLEAVIRDAILAQIKLAASKVGEEITSMGVGQVSQYGAQPAPIAFNTVDELLPKESDYYYKDYRAISATLSPCYGLDFSKPGVLKESVEMLAGQTVYKDHCFYSVDYWVGVVSGVTWDEKGADVGDIPGINAKLKLDSKKDPMLIRGVACEPPAVHSVSVTVLFEFEFSHPDLAEEGRFWQLLMEEVGGQLVRLIVTKIHGYWEISLVFQGAQEENKQLPASGVDKEQMSADGGSILQTQRSETVKLTPEQRALLGLSDTVAEDVPETILLPALTQLGARAQAGDALMETARAECRRVARLAILGSEEGTLPPAIDSLVNKADVTELAGLTADYNRQVALRFPNGGRSSVEETAVVHQAGGIEQPTQAAKPVKPVPVY
jgi:hypothetical protein